MQTVKKKHPLRDKLVVAIVTAIVTALLTGTSLYFTTNNFTSNGTTTSTFSTTAVSYQTVTTISVQTQTVTTTEPVPKLIEIRGTVTSSGSGTTPTKLTVLNSTGVIKSIDLTLTSNHAYDVTLSNGFAYTFHVYYNNLGGAGGGDHDCVVIDLTAGPRTTVIKMDVTC